MPSFSSTFSQTAGKIVLLDFSHRQGQPRARPGGGNAVKKSIRPWVARMAAVLALVCLLWIPGAPVRAEGLSADLVATSRLLNRFTLADGTPIVVPLMTLASDPAVPAFCLTPHAVEPYPSSPVGYVRTGPEALFGSEAFIRGVTAIVQHG